MPSDARRATGGAGEPPAHNAKATEAYWKVRWRKPSEPNDADGALSAA